MVHRTDDPQARFLLDVMDAQALFDLLHTVPDIETAGLVGVCFVPDGLLDLVPWLMAASTAPQWVWPSTTTSRQPRWPAAYSMLPSWWSSMTLPASRMTNSSPMPAEKMFSGMTRESEQVTMMA